MLPELDMIWLCNLMLSRSAGRPAREETTQTHVSCRKMSIGGHLQAPALARRVGARYLGAQEFHEVCAIAMAQLDDCPRLVRRRRPAQIASTKRV